MKLGLQKENLSTHLLIGVTYTYNYLGNFVNFTVSSDVSQDKISAINKEIEDTTEKKYHDETINSMNNVNNSINQQSQQNQQFYNNILSNDYNQNQAGDTLNGISSSSSQIDDSNYTGLFSTIFSKLSSIFNSDYNNVSIIEIPYPFTTKKLTFRSDIMSERIKHTFLGTFLQTFWMFSFGMYIFRFSYNIVKSAKDASVLNGVKTQTEVITDSLL